MRGEWGECGERGGAHRLARQSCLASLARIVIVVSCSLSCFSNVRVVTSPVLSSSPVATSCVTFGLSCLPVWGLSTVSFVPPCAVMRWPTSLVQRLSLSAIESSPFSAWPWTRAFSSA
jgi:hypothetical protein